MVKRKTKTKAAPEITMDGPTIGAQSLGENVIGAESLRREPRGIEDLELPCTLVHPTRTIRKRQVDAKGKDKLDENDNRIYDEVPFYVTAENKQDLIGHLKAGFRPV